MRTQVLFSWLFMCSILLVSVYALEVSDGNCLGSQKSVLLQLKNSLTFNHTSSKKLLHWNESSDCCSWEGVSCKQGYVTGLDLSREWISSGLDNSSSLFNLQHLVKLDLSCNFFNSEIPSRIRDLNNLSHLNLSYAGLVGQIPIGVSQLSSLVTLDISSEFDPIFPRNVLKLESPRFSTLVQNLSELEELYLDGVAISSPGSVWCEALASSTPNLRVLSLSYCSLSGPLDDSLAKLQSLSVINLSLNFLSATVPRFFANFSKLTSLNLWFCNLYGTFPYEIFQVPTLQTLDITFNSLLQGTLPEFPKNSALRSLHVAYNNFNGTIPDSIANLPQLASLYLSGNKFTGSVPSFNMSKRLTQIDLSYNGLTGEVPSSHWEGLLNLVKINLGHNFLSGSVPLSLFVLPSLEEIILSNNQFSGEDLEFQTLSSSRLDILEMSGNNLEGPFPSSIIKLKNLSVISLAHNKFNGTLQLDMFKDLSRLDILSLSWNSLTINDSGNDSTLASSFPLLRVLLLASCNMTRFPNLRNRSSLTDLDLLDNKLYGEIPNWIWEGRYLVNLSCNYLDGFHEPYSLPDSLYLLDLHMNQLSGKIPILPPFSQYVDFASNNFTASIPVDYFDGLANLSYFSLSKNTLTGIIPESVCSQNSLGILDLFNSNLSGNLPTCIIEMSKHLWLLNLGGNNFKGPIHNAFPSDCSLQFLDLNGNLIDGEVPKSLSNCTRLSILDLGQNQMSGKFPCWLTNTSTLRVIVLRSNKFHGSILCPDTNGTWPFLQIFYLAQNNFSGKLPGEQLTKFQAMVGNDDDISKANNNDILGFLVLPPLKAGLNIRQLVHYRAIVSVTSKGLEMEMQKMLTIFIYMDLSCNNFHGAIPEELGLLRALYTLNLSNNGFTGEIPSSIGNLRKMESLDLSMNNLSGSIPPSLASLNFLSFLNLSFNHLVGSVPAGNQIQTFSADSFLGNEGLCGFPLQRSCTAPAPTGTLSPNSTKDDHSGNRIDWNLLSFEFGLIFGFGVIVGPLMFCRRWRKWYYNRVDDSIINYLPSVVSRKWVLWTTPRKNKKSRQHDERHNFD